MVLRAVPGLGPLLVVAATAGCLYDPDDRCGAHQRLDDHDTCVCDDGAVVVGYACEPCPAGEVVVDGACTCPAGQVRDPLPHGCVAGPTGQGAACSPTAACATAADPLCTSDGYCSRGCTGPGDCVGGYACDVGAPQPFCVRPPSGLQAPCASSADCAGYEASYCETSVSNVCLVAGCVVGADDCFIGWVCCDLTGFGIDTTLCVPEGQCPA